MPREPSAPHHRVPPVGAAEEALAGGEAVAAEAEVDSDPYTNAWPRCNVVRIRAHVTCTLDEGNTLPVYFRLFDVDDPDWPKNGETDVDDDTYTKSGDNYPIGNPGAALKEHLTDTGGTLIKVTLHSDDKDSVAAFLVITQPYPGNNWRFAASTNKEWLEGLRIDESDGFTLRDAESYIVESKATSRLTCWRYLHVEVDSMGPPSEQGNSTALTPTTLTDSGAQWVDQQFSSYLETWLVTPDFNEEEPEWFEIDDTDSANQRLTIKQGNLLDTGDTRDLYVIKFDWSRIPPQEDDPEVEDIDDPDVEALPVVAAFWKACVTVVRDTRRDSSMLPWHRNFDFSSDLQRDYAKSHCGTLNSPSSYWAVYIVGAYEGGPHEDKDNDDLEGDTNDELCTPGAWYGTDPTDETKDVSLFFQETHRDCASEHGWDENEKARARHYAVIHEIGHHFELADDRFNDLHVMWAADPVNAGEDWRKSVPLLFKPADIARIRKCSNP